MRNEKTKEEQLAIVKEGCQPGNTFELVAKKYGIAVRRIYVWASYMKRGNARNEVIGSMVYDVVVMSSFGVEVETQVLGYDSAKAFFDEYPEHLGYIVSIECNPMAYIRKHTSFKVAS